MLTVRDLCVGYRDGELILNDLGFSLERGQILSILGPNGVGKTTLLRCLNAMIRPWAGVVQVEEMDVFRSGRADIAKKLGYVAQRSEAGRVSVFDAVLLGRKPHLRWRVSREDLTKVDAILNRLGLAHLALRHVNEMSGGEWQKVCIARALVQEPRVLLLDEPTSSLDLKNQLDILETIRRVIREHEIIAVLTMHDLNLAFRFTDRFVFLKQGRIFAQGVPEEATAEMVAAVYGVHVDILKYNSQVLIVPHQLSGSPLP